MKLIVQNNIDNRPLFYRSYSRDDLDSMFVVASEINDSKLLIEKFYINKMEYERYSMNLDDAGNNLNKSFRCRYSRQTIDLYSFLNFFDLNIDLMNNEENDLIDRINEKIKNYVLSFNGDQIEITISESRRVVNEYFNNRQYIKQKDAEHFPFNININFDGDDDVRFRLYNVGQANCSALIINEIPKIIFDLGKSRKCPDSIDMLSTKLLLDDNSRKTIIISHYDNDHINMACHLPNSGANLQFIMPDFLNSSDIYKPNIQLLLTRAINNGNNICLILNDKLNRPLDLGGLKIYQGSSCKKDIHQSTNENSHGLLCYLNIRDKTIFIPGDALYGDLYTSLPAPINADYVIIPHHSCDYTSPINLGVIDLFSVKEAFVFCGPHYSYHHPNHSHFIQYLKAGAKLKRLSSPSSSRNIVFFGRNTISDIYFDYTSSGYYEWVL